MYVWRIYTAGESDKRRKVASFTDIMESTQVADPPDINEVKLRILAADPKASEAYFQNSLNSTTPNRCNNTNSKSPEEFSKGVPRDAKVPGEMITLLEDQNKNRLKNSITTTAGGDGGRGSSFPCSYPLTIAPAVNKGDISNGKSKSGSKSCSDASGITSNHVEIDVDMTLPHSETEETRRVDDSLVTRSGNAASEIISHSQKTDASGSCNSRNTVIMMNNHSTGSANTIQSSSVTLDHQDQEERYGMQHQQRPQYQPSSPHLPPSCEKDLEMLRNVRKVYVQLTDDNTPCYYKVSDESQECLFETVLGDTNGSIWSRYFKQQQKVILVHDRNQRGVLKLEFGRSRTISCCQTLRYAAMTASFKSKPEEPLCIIFKDKECCVSCCCCPEATYETVPQQDSILPFSVFTKGRWKNRAELMVKHNDGSILGFIDKLDKNSYSLTIGENVGQGPANLHMKICMISFVIAMDVMDRQDAGKLSCYLRPTTILLIFLLLMLCITIGGYLLHHFSTMFFSVKEDSVLCGTFDEAGSRRTAPVPHFNNDRTSDSITSSGGTTGLSAEASAIMNSSSSSSSSSSPTSEFHLGGSSLSASTAGNTGIGAAATTIIGGSNSSSWPMF